MNKHLSQMFYIFKHSQTFVRSCSMFHFFQNWTPLFIFNVRIRVETQISSNIIRLQYSILHANIWPFIRFRKFSFASRHIIRKTRTIHTLTSTHRCKRRLFFKRRIWQAFYHTTRAQRSCERDKREGTKRKRKHCSGSGFER